MLDHYVLGLYIPVDDALIVHVFQRRSRLLPVVRSFLLGKPTLNVKGSTLVRKSLKRHWEQYSRTR